MTWTSAVVCSCCCGRLWRVRAGVWTCSCGKPMTPDEVKVAHDSQERAR